MHMQYGEFTVRILDIDSENAISRIEDAGIYKEIACAFADRIPEYLAQLETALKNSEVEKATRIVHSIKSNCATVGCESLRLAFLALENLGREQNIPAFLALLGKVRPQLLQLREQLGEITSSITP